MHKTLLTCYKNAGYSAFLYFVSENFAKTVLEGLCSACKAFLQKNDCALVALQKFLTLKGKKKGIDPMSIYCIDILYTCSYKRISMYYSQ